VRKRADFYIRPDKKKTSRDLTENSGWESHPRTRGKKKSQFVDLIQDHIKETKSGCVCGSFGV